MIAYSLTSRRAIARLYRAYNDIDIYVEDKTYVGVYEKLINKALKGRARVSKVIPLGPKDEVLKQASIDREAGGQPRLYIVDGDLDLVAFQRLPSYPHLYRLNVYSMENLLIDVRAMERYCAFASPNLQMGNCVGSVNPTQLIEEVELLTTYIKHLAIAKRLHLRSSLFAINPPSVTRSINGKHVGVAVDKLKYRNKEIARAIISQVGLVRYKQARRAVSANVAKRNIENHKIVPGKLFAMMYLNERVAAAGGSSMQQKMVISYLSDTANLDLDQRLSARLRRVAKG